MFLLSFWRYTLVKTLQCLIYWVNSQLYLLHLKMDLALSRVCWCQFPIPILAFNHSTLDDLLDLNHGGSSFITLLINFGLFHAHLEDTKRALHITFCFQLADCLVDLSSVSEIFFDEPMPIFSKDVISQFTNFTLPLSSLKFFVLILNSIWALTGLCR